MNYRTKEVIIENKESIVQIIKFAIVGASNAIVYYACYTLLLLFFDYYQIITKYDYIAAQYISFFLSVLWSFFWNNMFVFEKNEKWYYCLIKTIIVYSITGIFLSTILLYLMIELMKIHKLVAPIINIIIGFPINYLLNKKWAFK